METQTLTDVVNTANQMSMWDLVWASDMVTKVVMILSLIHISEPTRP